MSVVAVMNGAFLLVSPRLAPLGGHVGEPCSLHVGVSKPARKYQCPLEVQPYVALVRISDPAVQLNALARDEHRGVTAARFGGANGFPAQAWVRCGIKHLYRTDNG